MTANLALFHLHCALISQHFVKGESTRLFIETKGQLAANCCHYPVSRLRSLAGYDGCRSRSETERRHGLLR